MDPSWTESDKQSALQYLLSRVPEDHQGNPLEYLLDLASLLERAGVTEAAPPSTPRALPPPKKIRGASTARSALTRLPAEILRHVLSYRDLPTRYACASASRLLCDTVGCLSLATERCLVQRAHPILATVCDVSALDAKTLGDLVLSQKDIFRSEPDLIGHVTVPTPGVPPVAPSTASLREHVFSLELTAADGTEAPFFLATATLGMHHANSGAAFQLRFPGTDWSTRTTVQRLSEAGRGVRARIFVARRVAGGIQCAKLMDRVLQGLHPGGSVASLRVYDVASIEYNAAIRDLHTACFIEVESPTLFLRYDTGTPHAGFYAKISSITIESSDEYEIMNTSDLRTMLDHWVPWSRHVENIPLPPGAPAVRWSSFEHLRTYARNARDDAGPLARAGGLLPQRGA